MKGIAGKRVLITGASSGIGFHAAALLVKNQARVHITGLPPQSDVRAAAERIGGDSGNLTYSALDITDDHDVRAVVKRAEESLGAIDVLINNAGVASQARVVDQELREAEREFDVNYFGMFRVTRAVLPGMIALGGGTILNVASTLARVPGPTQANYSASKAAIAAFSSALRSEVEDQGIAVKVFVPGLTSTPMTQSLNVGTVDLLDPEEVAGHMLKAVSGRRTEYVTGTSYRALEMLSRAFPESARRLVKRYY